VPDHRAKPQIETFRILLPLLVMFLCRFGSLNSLDKSRKARQWDKLLEGADLPSADSLGRVPGQIDPEALRLLILDFYRNARRKKVLPMLEGDMVALVFDGHESTSSYLRSCPGCLEREVGKEGERRIQYYHRWVCASLVGKDFHLFLDAEPIRPGEGEVVVARRLYERVHPLYSRAYDIVLGDAIYLEGPFFQEVLDNRKDVIAVLKRDDLALFVDAEALFAGSEPEVFRRRGRLHQCWDMEGFTSFSTVKRPLRVVKSIETFSVKRQRTGEMEETTSTWMWATTISCSRLGTKDFVAVGHARWEIEERGFNAAVNHYHLDHVYRHDPAAMLTFLLLGMLAMNLFEVFYRRNLKPALRDRYSRLDIARIAMAEIYATIGRSNTS